MRKPAQIVTTDGNWMAEEWPWGGWAVYQAEGFDAWRFICRCPSKDRAVEYVENNSPSSF